MAIDPSSVSKAENLDATSAIVAPALLQEVLARVSSETVQNTANAYVKNLEIQNDKARAEVRKVEAEADKAAEETRKLRITNDTQEATKGIQIGLRRIALVSASVIGLFTCLIGLYLLVFETSLIGILTLVVGVALMYGIDSFTKLVEFAGEKFPFFKRN